jgi:alpha-L-rhamnosidase
VETIITDERWQMSRGPITFSCVYGGEDFDARLVQHGWDSPKFAASTWAAANVVNGPGGELRGLSAAAPPLKLFETYAPKTITPITNGVSVYDFGQNAPFIARLKVKGPAGAIVRIIPAELVKANGTVDRGSSGGRPAYWQYTLSRGESETWFPKFFYHGSRYFQVELKPANEGGELPVVEQLAGVVVHTSSETTGEFACSNDLFNRIHTLVRWAQRANLVSVLTDCPHRERLGWLEQYHLNGPSLRYEFDLAQLFTKGMNDMADAQLANGLVPNIAPEYVVFGPAAWDRPERSAIRRNGAARSSSCRGSNTNSPAISNCSAIIMTR